MTSENSEFHKLFQLISINIQFSYSTRISADYLPSFSDNEPFKNSVVLNFLRWLKFIQESPIKVFGVHSNLMRMKDEEKHGTDGKVLIWSFDGAVDHEDYIFIVLSLKSFTLGTMVYWLEWSLVEH